MALHFYKTKTIPRLNTRGRKAIHGLASLFSTPEKRKQAQ